jgi:hypothetical protein
MRLLRSCSVSGAINSGLIVEAPRSEGDEGSGSSR